MLRPSFLLYVEVNPSFLLYVEVNPSLLLYVEVNPSFLLYVEDIATCAWRSFETTRSVPLKVVLDH